MLLRTEKIFELLSNPPDPNDPLVIRPKPDRTGLITAGAASVDLRLGCWFSVPRQDRAWLLDVGKTIPRGPENGDLREDQLMKMHYVCYGRPFFLHPGSFALGVTLEWIRLSTDLGGYVTSRSRLGRRGLVIATATGVHPGFSGSLTLELSNLGQIPIAIYPGMRICQFFLHTTEPTESKHLDQSNFVCNRRPVLGTIELDDVAKALGDIEERRASPGKKDPDQQLRFPLDTE